MPLAVLASYCDLLDSYEFEERIGNSLVISEPVGVVGAITPWNYPLHQAMAKVAATDEYKKFLQEQYSAIDSFIPADRAGAYLEAQVQDMRAALAKKS